MKINMHVQSNFDICCGVCKYDIIMSLLPMQNILRICVCVCRSVQARGRAKRLNNNIRINTNYKL